MVDTCAWRNRKDVGGKRYVIYPFGILGKWAKGILNAYFGINEYMIVDNRLAEKYTEIKDLKALASEEFTDLVVLICSNNEKDYAAIRHALYEVVPSECCEDIFPAIPINNLVDLANLNEDERVNSLLYRSYETARQLTAEFVYHNMISANILPNRFAHIEYLLHEKLVNSELGMMMEFGCCEGLSVNFIAAAMPSHTIYGFDSFEGLPEEWFGSNRAGAFSRNGKIPPARKNVEYIKGWFEQSLPLFLEQHTDNCAFLHIDSDLYSSAKTILSLLKNRIVSGTIILFDEYFNYPGWQLHEYRAFQEFVEENNVKYEYISYTERGEEVAVKIISIGR